MSITKASNKEKPLADASTLDVPPAATSLSLRESPQRWWLAALLNLGLLFCYVHRSALSVAAPDLNAAKINKEISQ